MSLPLISIGSPISVIIFMIISMVTSVIQLHGSNCAIANVWNPGLSLQGGLWLKIEGSYVHLSSNVTPFCMYILVVSLIMGPQTFLFEYLHHQARFLSQLFIYKLWIPPSSACVTSTSCLGFPNRRKVLPKRDWQSGCQSSPQVLKGSKKVLLKS